MPASVRDGLGVAGDLCFGWGAHADRDVQTAVVPPAMYSNGACSSRSTVGLTWPMVDSPRLCRSCHRPSRSSQRSGTSQDVGVADRVLSLKAAVNDPVPARSTPAHRPRTRPAGWPYDHGVVTKSKPQRPVPVPGLQPVPPVHLLPIAPGRTLPLPTAPTAAPTRTTGSSTSAALKSSPQPATSRRRAATTHALNAPLDLSPAPSRTGLGVNQFFTDLAGHARARPGTRTCRPPRGQQLVMWASLDRRPRVHLAVGLLRVVVTPAPAAARLVRSGRSTPSATRDRGRPVCVAGCGTGLLLGSLRDCVRPRP